MKNLINKFRSSVWLYPVIYSLVALILSIVITFIDKTYTDELSYFVNGIFYTTPALAQTVLGIVAGAFITIATFTFSTTMVVLTMYSSQFTPRVVENFLNNETTMKSFGIFISGFIYAVTSILFIDVSVDGNLILAASVGVVYVIVGLIYFILFIHSVSTHIQASDLILRLHLEALDKIKEYRDFIKESKIISEDGMLEIAKDKNALKVFSPSDGYIQEIDYQRLQKLAENHKGIFCFKKVVGQFVSTETRILTIYDKGQEAFDEKVVNQIQKCVIIGNKKTQAQDFSFTIQKIVEIAVKALSPGINDPNTAIHCLRIIGVLLRDLADIKKGYVILKEDDESGFIIYEAFDLEVLLYDAYNQIMFYGQSDASVVVEGFKSLRFIRAKASRENRNILKAYTENLYEKLMSNAYGKFEYSKIIKEYNELIKD
ncbi:MAG: DUF2254 domain-containing protein [Vallitaleaceae bacterium]|nr:DUF2254 domain-containing protein [Vallitaleaceae bacterium]